MKTTLTISNIADALRNDSNAGWSYAGAVALADHLVKLDEMKIGRASCRERV